MPRQVTVGKNILDILTTGMYKDACVILREFVQNSVDSLEQALERGIYATREELPVIRVDANDDAQTLVVEDEGVGVPASEAWTTLTSIAASEKDRTRNLGFRGIGRLAGLAYCSRMTIETSARGEDVKTVLTWDADKLRTLIHDPDYRCSAQEIVQQVTTFTNTDSEDPERSYYRVALEGVTDDDLLGSDAIKDYLAHVAPVPFRPSKFIFVSMIRDGLAERGVPLREYRVFVNNDQIFKPYRTGLYEPTKDNEKRIAQIIDIEFREFRRGNELVAVCWYGIADPLQLIKISNPVGIRLRKGNIQVGDRYSLQPLFADNRFHKYFVGEIHIIHSQCVPNGRRDYFEDTPVFRELESEFRKFASALSRLCRGASQVSAGVKKIEAFGETSREFEQKSRQGTFVGPEEREQAERKLKDREEKAVEAEDEIQRAVEGAGEESREILEKLAERQRKSVEERLGGTADDSPSSDAPETKKRRPQYLTSHLSGLDRKERKLVGKVYKVIKQVLPAEVAENLIAKIQEELKLSGKNGQRPQ